MALVSADGVYDAAFRRAGMLRVCDLTELFAAVFERVEGEVATQMGEAILKELQALHA